MKLGQPAPGAQGSFGIPQELKDARERIMTQRDEVRPGTESPVEEDDSDPSVPRQSVDVDMVEDEEKIPESITNPLVALAKLGVSLEDEDFQKVMFKGFVEKEDILIVPGFRGVRPLKATFKTLTVKEYDEVDELLAEDIRDRKMTNDGFASRRSMWILSYGVTKLQGKPLPAVFYGEPPNKVFDSKETAKSRRNVLGDLSHAVINRMIHVHAAMTVAIESIISDPEAIFLKKS